MSNAFDILAAVTASGAAKRHSTVSGVGGMNPTASASKLQHSTSSFHSLGRKEQPITPPSSPPPPPPLHGILPPPVAPKPKKHGSQQKANEEPEDTYEDTISNLDPLYEPIPGDQLEQEGTDYVDVVPPTFVDSSENIYDEDAGYMPYKEQTLMFHMTLMMFPQHSLVHMIPMMFLHRNLLHLNLILAMF